MNSTDSSQRQNVVRVENTNSESLLSKLSIVELGYRPDPFLKLFATSVGNRIIRSRRSPAINRGYLTRMIAVENSVEKLVLLNSKLGRGFQVLSLGAGYDTTYFRLRNSGIISGDECSYFEVDFPNVADTKCRKISENRILRSFFTKYDSFENYSCYKFDEGRFCLVGCNMTDTQMLEDKLNELGYDWNKLTIILTECSTTYVDVGLSLQLLRWLTEKISNFVFVDYEQIRPSDCFGQIMKRHFSNRGSPLKCIDFYPTTFDHYRRFVDLGWTECRIQTLEQIFRTYFGLSERNRIRRLLDDTLDEAEELQLKCSHYTLIVGTKLTDRYQHHHLVEISNKQEVILPFHESLDSAHLHLTSDPELFQRFGHSMVATSEFVYIFGGFSKSKQRDNIFVKVKNEVGRWPIVEKRIFPSEQTLFCGTATTSKSAFIFGGRASPKDPSDKLFLLNLKAGSLEEVSNSDISGQKPSARWKHTLTAVSDNELVLVGGKSVDQVFSDIYLFDVDSKKWSFKHRLDHGLHSHSAVLQGRKLIISGGLDGRGNIVPHFYSYDWNEKKRSKAVTRFQVNGYISRFSHTSHIVPTDNHIKADQLVLIGGVSSAQEPGIAVIDLTNKTCREFSLEKILLEAPLTLHTSYVVNDDDAEKNVPRIVVFGGGTNCFSFGMHLNKFVIDLKIPL